MAPTYWKIGALATRAGVTVRTLHHYDDIGLLKPSAHTEAGYRLYTDTDAARLARIVLLRQLGMSLSEIRAALAHQQPSLATALGLHIQRLEQEIAHKTETLARLRTLESYIHEAPQPEQQLDLVLEAMNMIQKYYTEEQLQFLAQRRQTVGNDRIQEVQNEWNVIFEGFRSAMDRNLDPTDAEVQRLVTQSNALIAEFTGNNPGVQKSLQTMYAKEGAPKVLRPHGAPLDPKLWDYMQQARASAESASAEPGNPKSPRTT